MRELGAKQGADGVELQVFDEVAGSRYAANDPRADGSAVARFQHAVIRVWHETLWVDCGDGLHSDLRERHVPVITLSFQYDAFHVRATEPRDRVFCSHGGAMIALARDRQAEQQARLLLEGFGAIEIEALAAYAVAPDCDADYVVQPEGSEQVHCAFVAHALPQLRALGFCIELDEQYPYRVVQDATWYARLEADEEKPDWFGLELGIEVSGHRVDLLPVLLEMLDGVGKHFDWSELARRAPRFIKVPGQSCYVEVPADQFSTLARVVAELYQGEDGGQLRFPIARAPALVLLHGAFEHSQRPLRIDGQAANTVMTHARSLVPTPNAPAQEAACPDGLQAQLRPYQADGLAWLQRLRSAGAGGVLADDMGLGKTLQAIAHLCTEKQQGRLREPALVVAPTSVVGNWARELARFAPSLRVVVLYGSARHAHRHLTAESDVVLTSYSVLLRDADFFGEQRFSCVILDEAQAIKNPRSRAAQLAKGLVAGQRIALSGTPMENNLQELWSLFDFAMPGLLGSELQFRHFYRIPIEHQQNTERLEILRSQIAPYLIRRMKEQVATELPPKTELVRAVELHGKQRELYESIRVAVHDKVRDALRKQGLAGATVTILAALTRLRQLCCDPRLLQTEQARFVRESAKYEFLMELLAEQRVHGRGVLVFSQFASMLSLISQGLTAQGVSHATLTGATVDRNRPVRAFERGDVDVFLISLKAGGTGLNLVRAETVIHYDPWWNPAAQDQATDRAYRIGQQKPVFVHSLIAAGSVEERMLALQQKKRRLASAVVAGAGQSTQPLCEAEVEHLLAPLDGD